jgi:expansin
MLFSPGSIVRTRHTNTQQLFLNAVAAIGVTPRQKAKAAIRPVAHDQEHDRHRKQSPANAMTNRRTFSLARRAVHTMLLLAAICPLGLAQCPDAPVVHSGKATFYLEADGGGACMFDPTPNDLMVGAMNTADFANSAICGSCVSITGPHGTITVRIVDLCPGCASGSIDLSPLAFSLLADTSLGKVPITWHLVPCNLAGPVAYHFKEESNQWWTAIQIRNHRYPVATFEFQNAQGVYQSVSRTGYNYFIKADGMGTGPFAFRVTDIYGHVVEDAAVNGAAGATVSGQAQFASCDSTTSTGEWGRDDRGHFALPSLAQNYPNPFNPTTTIEYVLPLAGNVSLTIFDNLGQQVARLVNTPQPAGLYRVTWHAAGLPSGLYFCRLLANGHTQTRKLVISR